MEASLRLGRKSEPRPLFLSLAFVCVSIACLLACSNDLPQATPTSFAVTSSALSVPDVVESTIPSIVQVTVRSEDGSEIGTGTGIVLNDEGVHHHQLARHQRFGRSAGYDFNGTLLPASLLREDQSLDLAVLAVVGANLEPATFGDSDFLTRR